MTVNGYGGFFLAGENTLNFGDSCTIPNTLKTTDYALEMGELCALLNEIEINCRVSSLFFK